MTEPHGFEQRRKALESSFFAHTDAKLLEDLRAQVAKEKAQQKLASELGIDDEAIVQKLSEAGVQAESLAALGLAPLVAVGWADGKMEDAEREAILKAAAEKGITAGSPSHELLNSWLKSKPEAALVEHWSDFVSVLKASLAPAEHRKLGEELIGSTRKVANAAGGFLGIGKISPAEEEMLTRLKQPFA